MDLITVILLSVALWIVYKIYKSYIDIVKELQMIREKCIKEGISSKEALTSHISENYTSDAVKSAKDSVLSALKLALDKAS
jgi:cell division protein FtsL